MHNFYTDKPDIPAFRIGVVDYQKVTAQQLIKKTEALKIQAIALYNQMFLNDYENGALGITNIDIHKELAENLKKYKKIKDKAVQVGLVKADELQTIEFCSKDEKYKFYPSAQGNDFLSFQASAEEEKHQENEKTEDTISKLTAAYKKRQKKYAGWNHKQGFVQEVFAPVISLTLMYISVCDSLLLNLRKLLVRYDHEKKIKEIDTRIQSKKQETKNKIENNYFESFSNFKQTLFEFNQKRHHLDDLTDVTKEKKLKLVEESNDKSPRKTL